MTTNSVPVPTPDYTALLHEIAQLKARMATQEERGSAGAVAPIPSRPMPVTPAREAGAINGLGERVADLPAAWSRRTLLAGALLAAAGTAAVGAGALQVGAQSGSTPPTVTTPEPPHAGNGNAAPGSGVAPRIAPRLAGSDVVHSVTYPGTAFLPRDSTTTYSYSSAGNIYATVVGAFDCPISNLPVGAVINAVVFSFFKNNANDSYFSLYSLTPSTGAFSNIASANTSAFPVSTIVASVSVPVSVPVTNDTAYFARWLPGDNTSSQVLYGVEVTYTYPNNAYGQTTASGGVGVYGSSTSGYGVYGTSMVSAGVYGIGTGAGSYGVLATASASSTAGVYATSSTPNTPAFYAVNFAAPNPPNSNAGFFIGQVYINGPLVIAGGAKSAAVPHPDGSHRLLYCVESPESWFEDFGEGTITAGKAEVKLDPDFAAVVNTAKLHVFLTPHDEGHNLHLTARGAAGFSVAASATGEALAKGKKASDVSGTFTYRVVAKRKDVVAPRLAKFDLPKPLPAPPRPLDAQGDTSGTDGHKKG